MTKLDAALAEKLCAEAMEDDERMRLNVSDDDAQWEARQDAFDRNSPWFIYATLQIVARVGDPHWEGGQRAAAIARTRNNLRALAEQLMAAMEELDRLRKIRDLLIERGNYFADGVAGLAEERNSLRSQLADAIEEIARLTDECVSQIDAATDQLQDRESQLADAKAEGERMRAVYEAAVRWRSGWPPNARVGGMTKDVADLFNAIDTALSQDKERP